MPQSTAGYSGTPLAKKLGIATGMRVCLLDAPPELRDWLAPLPEGVEFTMQLRDDTDLVHLFVTRAEDLARRLTELRQRLPPEAAVWVSWPKKAAKVPTTVTEDTVRELALPLGYVDVKVCAVSDVWSGLKLVVRKALR
jgi:choline dehydrogenase-like flavoprotein